jgi:hypothetical protein
MAQSRRRPRGQRPQHPSGGNERIRAGRPGRERPPRPRQIPSSAVSGALHEPKTESRSAPRAVPFAHRRGFHTAVMPCHPQGRKIASPTPAPAGAPACPQPQAPQRLQTAPCPRQSFHAKPCHYHEDSPAHRLRGIRTVDSGSEASASGATTPWRRPHGGPLTGTRYTGRISLTEDSLFTSRRRPVSVIQTRLANSYPSEGRERVRCTVPLSRQPEH